MTSLGEYEKDQDPNEDASMLISNLMTKEDEYRSKMKLNYLHS
jgi:hypothetical protein